MIRPYGFRPWTRRWAPTRAGAILTVKNAPLNHFGIQLREKTALRFRHPAFTNCFLRC